MDLGVVTLYAKLTMVWHEGGSWSWTEAFVGLG